MLCFALSQIHNMIRNFSWRMKNVYDFGMEIVIGFCVFKSTLQKTKIFVRCSVCTKFSVQKRKKNSFMRKKMSVTFRFYVILL